MTVDARLPQCDESIALQKGDVRLEVWPRHGGRIALLQVDGFDVLRPIPLDMPKPQSLRAGGSYPLVPYSNRIAEGKFRFEGKRYSIPGHPIALPHSLHGTGWQRPWSLIDQTETQIGLALLHEADIEWPWHFRAEQHFRLLPDGLEITMTLANDSDHAMPAGLGFHPFFPRLDAQLKADFDYHWQPVNGIPAGPNALPRKYDFRAGLTSPVGLDDGFSGWKGKAELIYPESGRKITMTADPVLDFMILFMPPGRDFVCVEPVSHATNAVNLAADGIEGTGMRSLASRESMEASLTLRLS